MRTQWIGSGLGNLPILVKGRSGMVSAENPTGEKGKAAMTGSHLGPTRKGCPCIANLKQGETATILALDGPGVIEHIFITVTDRTEKNYYVLRDLVLRMYWDGEETPSVESPLGDFFCNGFGATCNVNSLPIVCNPTRGLNCYFQMPFHKSAKITIENQHPVDIPNFFWEIDFCQYEELPENIGYFHAQWRREPLTTLQKDYVILDGVKGSGHYIGTYMALQSLERYWWGEGEVKFYIDGDDPYPSIAGTGVEDYFGGAWGFPGEVNGEPVEETFNTPFMGYPYYSNKMHFRYEQYVRDVPPMRGMYRWHILDPIRFSNDLKVTVQQIGWGINGYFERQDDLATVAYWYQSEPHGKFPILPEAIKRWPR